MSSPREYCQRSRLSFTDDDDSTEISQYTERSYESADSIYYDDGRDSYFNEPGVWSDDLLESKLAELRGVVRDQERCLGHLEEMKSQNKGYMEHLQQLHGADTATYEQRYSDTVRLSYEVETVSIQIKDLEARNRTCNFKFHMDENRRIETVKKLEQFKIERQRTVSWINRCDDIDKETVEDYCKEKRRLKEEVEKFVALQAKKKWYVNEIAKRAQNYQRSSGREIHENHNNPQTTENCHIREINTGRRSVRNGGNEEMDARRGRELKSGFLPDINQNQRSDCIHRNRVDNHVSDCVKREKLPNIVPKPPKANPGNGGKKVDTRMRENMGGNNEQGTSTDSNKGGVTLPVIPRPPETRRDNGIKRFYRKLKNIVR